MNKKFPKHGLNAKKAFDVLQYSLKGDKNPDKNFITFVNTQPEKYMDKIYNMTKNINFIDHEPYYKEVDIVHDMVKMMAHLYKDPVYGKAKGMTTVGSSEAIYVSTVFHKFYWEEHHKKKAANHCNMIWSENTHYNWDKAARWNDIQENKIKMKHLKWTFGAEDVKKRITPNTIAVVCSLCTTRTGQNDDIEGINNFLKDYKKKTGVFIPIHVDAAIGGFLAPFYSPRNLKWNFELEHVKTINVSLHKYGGIYSGIGMILIKSDYKIPEKMKFNFTAADNFSLQSGKKKYFDPHSEHPKKDNADKYDLHINFSKSSSQITSAYYMLLKLGIDGYKKQIEMCLQHSKKIVNYLTALKNTKGHFIFLKVSEPYYPNIAFYLQDDDFPLKEVITDLDEKYGYSIAAYKMGETKDIVFRLVFKYNITEKKAQNLLHALKKVISKNIKMLH